MSNFLYHNKYHRTNHHTNPIVFFPDSATDPIATQAEPFLGTFHNYIDIAQIGTVPIDVRYLLTFDDNSITTFTGLSMESLGSVYGVLTAAAYTESHQWYQLWQNIYTLSGSYSLYPSLTNIVPELSGNWSLGYNFHTNYSLNSAEYESNYTTVSTCSASWPFIDTTLRLNLVQENTRSKNFHLANITDATYLPYDEIHIIPTQFSASVYPVVPLSSNDIAQTTTFVDNLSDGNVYLLTSPIHFNLTEQQYRTLSSNNIIWYNQRLDIAADIFTSVTFDDIGYGGLIILNKSQALNFTYPSYEGIYTAIIDNTDVANIATKSYILNSINVTLTGVGYDVNTPLVVLVNDVETPGLIPEFGLNQSFNSFGISAVSIPVPLSGYQTDTLVITFSSAAAVGITQAASGLGVSQVYETVRPCFQAVKSINTFATTTSTYNIIPSNKTMFRINENSPGTGISISEQIKTGSVFSISGQEYRDTISIGLFKIKQSEPRPYIQTLSCEKIDIYTGSLDYHRQKDSASIFIGNVVEASSHIQVLVNPFISNEFSTTWLSDNIPSKAVRGLSIDLFTPISNFNFTDSLSTFYNRVRATSAFETGPDSMAILKDFIPPYLETNYLFPLGVVAMPSQTNIYWHLSSQQVAYIGLSTNSTLMNIPNPDNKKKGGEYYLIIQQDGYGEKTLKYESDYRFMQAEIVPQISYELQLFPANEIWRSVYYGNNTWIAIPFNSFNGARTIDNETWSAIPLPGARKWSSISFGISAWIIVAEFENVVARSIDNGDSWSLVSIGTTRPWSYVDYGNRTFIAVASASNIGVRSIDFGLTWSQFTLPFTADWASVKYGNGIWIAVAGGGFNGQQNNTQGAISTDNGINWLAFNITNPASPIPRKFSDVAYGEDYWVAVAKDSKVISLSSRLEGNEQWFDVLIPNAPSNGFSSIAHGNDTFIATTLDPTQGIMMSTNGTVWSTMATVPKKLYNVNFGGTSLGGFFYTVGKDGDDTKTYSNYQIKAFDAPDPTTTSVGVLTAPAGVTVIKFVCDGKHLYGTPSYYYVARGPVWTYFAGPGIIFTPSPSELLVNETFLPEIGITVEGSVVVDEGFSSPNNDLLILSGMPVP